MIGKTVAILVLLALAQTYARRDLKQGSSASVTSGSSASSTEGGSASASASGSASSNGGSVSVIAFASSEARAEARSALVQVVTAAVAEAAGGGNARALATANANAYATAIAETFTSAIASAVSNTPNGRGCASAFADARAEARAFAAILVEVCAQASNLITFADAGVAVDAITTATAEAYSSANAAACVNGVGSASAFQDSFSRADTTAYVEVLAAAYAAVSGGQSGSLVVVDVRSGRVEASVASSTGASQTEGPASASNSGTAGAATNQPPRCGNSYSQCCRSGGNVCSCGRSCFARRVSSSPGLTYRNIRNGDVCECR